MKGGLFLRKSGILMHISSLPSDYGIGKLGKEAYRFIDFLAESGIKLWQVLPLSPTSYRDSPYQSFSTFAGNPYFIDFDILTQEGLLDKSDYCDIIWCENERVVDYGRIYDNCFNVLKRAYKKFKDKMPSNYHNFLLENKEWLDDYALFMALKFKNDGRAWYEWEKGLAMREEKAVERAALELSEEVDFFRFIQYKFYEQWDKLKRYANKKGIGIIGDIPIYVAYDSVDVWVSPELFLLDKEKNPVDVAGCPPDDFSKLGQLWGNPLYDWEYHKKDNYSWWAKRMEFASKMYDMTRIDHFRGFESFYAIPYGNVTAEHGEWRKGPGIEIFRTIEKKLGKMSIIAEDLGFITPEVRQLVEDTGFPSMKVLQFAFDGNAKNEYLPHNYKTSNCVVYTGTHDNDTLKGWVSTSPKSTIKYCLEYMKLRFRSEIAWGVIRLAWSSCAEIAIVQMQDLLNEGSKSRMNTPSTLKNNWTYRIRQNDLNKNLVHKLQKLNRIYDR